MENDIENESGTHSLDNLPDRNSPEEKLPDVISIFDSSVRNWKQAATKGFADGTGSWSTSADRALSLIERLEERIKRLSGTTEKAQPIEIVFAQAEPTVEVLKEWAEKIGLEMTEKEKSDED